MGYLLLEITRSPTNNVVNPVVLFRMEPVAAAALGAEKFLEPFIAQHQNWIGIDDQLSFFGVQASLQELLWLRQMQVELSSVA